MTVAIIDLYSVRRMDVVPSGGGGGGSRLRKEVKADIGMILISDHLASEWLFLSLVYSSTCRKFTQISSLQSGSTEEDR
jgi:hypothetical protein